MKLRILTLDFKNRLKQSYILLRKWYLSKWTKISEENRTSFFSFISIAFNYFQNALLLSIPVALLTTVSYPISVTCIWVALPFIEHYYVWFRESWKDNLIK